MDVQAVSCNLTLLDVYIENISFNRNENYKSSDANLKFKIEAKIEVSDDKKKCKTSISVEIKDDSLNITSTNVGIFGLIDFEKISKKTRYSLLNKNTLAILFPYVRSYITTISSQSGINPIILPPININKLIESQENKQSIIESDDKK